MLSMAKLGVLIFKDYVDGVSLKRKWDYDSESLGWKPVHQCKTHNGPINIILDIQ